MAGSVGSSNLKFKDPIVKDYGRTTFEGYQKGKHEATVHYRAILAMYKEMNEAIEARHEEEIKVVQIQAKLQVLDHLDVLFRLMHDKEEIESELRLAKARLQDVKVPTMDWNKLGEPKMWE